jgi:type 2 lantibiotic biosynthesis protein LanM
VSLVDAPDSRFGAYFPDRDEFAAVAPLVAAVDVDDLADRSAVVTSWRPGKRTERLEQAITTARANTHFAACTARLFATDLNQLEEELRASTDRGITDSAVTAVLADLLELLASRWLRIYVTDLHAWSARSALSGPTPEARFDDFVSRVDNDAYAADIAGRFEAMMRAGRTAIHGRRIQVRELHELLAGCPHIGQQAITGLAFGAGDTHRGGHSTAIVTFDDGTRCVHKPRDLRIEQGFYALCTQLFDTLGVTFPAPWIHQLDGGGGLMEYLDARLPNPAEQSEYYINLGRMAGLLYLLNGRDIHFENVVARGTMPIPIDLECLFQAPTRESAAEEPTATREIHREIADSVLSSMILPTALEAGGTTFRVGASGMVEHQESPLRVLTVVNGGRDDMRIELDTQTMQFDLTVPEIVGSEVSSYDLMTWVSDGVRSVLEPVCRDRAGFASLVTELFAGTRARFLNAPSMSYGQILRMLTHPSLAGRTDLSIAASARCVLTSEVRSVELLTGEILQLIHGDVPQFGFAVDQTTVDAGPYGAAVDVFDAPPLRVVVDRILALTDADIDRQAEFARLSFVSTMTPETERTDFSLTDPGDPMTVEALIQVAQGLGDELVADLVPAHSPDDIPAWPDVTIAATGEGLWNPGPMDQFWYGGLTGAAQFLLDLARVTGEGAYSATARHVLERFAGTCLRDRGLMDTFAVGASCGLGGIATTLLRAAASTDSALLHEAGNALLRSAAVRLESAEGDDFLSGVGGFLAAVTGLRDQGLHDPGALTEMADAALGVLAASVESGLAPITRFTGFAHGASGVLPYVWSWQDLPAAPRLADRLCRSLDELFIDGSAGWHTSDEHGGRAYGWCHGSPGILLGEVLSRCAGAPGDDRRLETALRLTESECFGRSFGLCHGDLGNLEILVLAHRHLGTGDAAALQRAGAALVRSSYAALRRDRPPRGAFTRSVMVGRLGVGHAALRLVDDEIPSFLML